MSGVVVESGTPTWEDGQLVRGCLVLRQPVVLGGVGNLSLGSLSREEIPPGGHRAYNPQAGPGVGGVGKTKPCLERGTGGKLECGMQSLGGLTW